MGRPGQRGAREKDADSLRATAALARGDLPAAAQAYREAIARGTSDPDAYNNLGVILAQEAKLDEAIPLFELALARKGDHQDARRNLAHARALRGIARFKAGLTHQAEEDLRAALTLDPGSARLATQLGEVLARLDRAGEAMEHYRRAIALDPRDAAAHINLGAMLYSAGRAAEAAPILERAVVLAPEQAAPLITLSGVEERVGQISRAEGYARRAVALAPRSADAHNNLGMMLMLQGDLPGALHESRQAVALAPGRADYQSTLLMRQSYDPAIAPEALAAQHRSFDALFGAPGAGRPRRPRDPARRLRVAYLSPDLRAHSVAFFFEPLLRAHDRGAVEVTCYADSAVADQTTDRLRGHAEHWRMVKELSDQALAETISADGIDVLVDLAGHTHGNRMSLLARRAAPVQFTYLGYPATTGLAAMDYRVTDGVADPAGAEVLHSERLVRIEGGFLCYAPPFPAGEGPGVVAPPSSAGQPVTFGSFNALVKVNEPLLDLWAALLREVPEARLLLKARGLGEERARERILARLAAGGVSPDRVTLAPAVPQLAAHLDCYAGMDVALDTFPYNGTTTTCEALWMGVPVVTFAGSAHAGRVGASILSRVGLDELVGSTPARAMEIAARLARDRQRLVVLRQTMRDRMRASPLMDAARLARQLEQAYRQS